MSQRQNVEKWGRAKIPDALPQKLFTRSNLNIPELANYKGTPPDEYWLTWEKKTYHELMPSKSWIDSNKLLRLAQKISYKDKEGRLKRALAR